MKLIRYAIVLAAVVTSVQTLAETLENYDVMTAGDLIELCSVGADDPSYGAAMGFCLGYIDATLDYQAALTTGPKFAPIACPDPTVTREEVVVVFLDWSKDNAQLLQSGTPVEGVMRAAFEKWPCSGQ